MAAHSEHEEGEPDSGGIYNHDEASEGESKNKCSAAGSTDSTEAPLQLAYLRTTC